MTETTTTSLPRYIEQPTKDALTGIENWLGSNQNRVYGTKSGESLFTDWNDMQKQSVGNTAWLADQDIGAMFGADKASSMWDQYAGSGAQTVDINSLLLDPSNFGRAAPNLSTNGVMDNTGPLGAFTNYMNPYTQNVLNPQLREIQQESDRQRRNIGASAAMGGAFGDARHGIMEGENMEKTLQQISDTTGQGYANAFNSALQSRQADMGRFDTMQRENAGLTENAQARRLQAAQGNQGTALTAAQANQRAGENAVERLGTAATAQMGIGDNLYGKFTDINDNLFNAGTLAQQNAEKKRATQQAFQEALNNHDYNSMVKLLQAAQGAPKESTSTTESDTGLFGLLGALAGGLF